ncbi:hypothetical protein FHQ08_07740 [Lactobacillus sp. CC-MHH1034]|uniref:hypothetical protein n=1 Tax=Agrilactobacillus fermenti TaxID=2586909 RepID=UPI001E5EB61B|nr:hypothetical protein [Agrilactobacillus fermenti]MCD2256610.1 hypothetical protein [Agrilactobacillus fermenti]
MRFFWRLMGIMIVCLLVLTGCSHNQSNSKAKDTTLKKITTAKPIWYLYRGEGTHSVISLQFLSNKTVTVKDIDEIGAPGGENRVDKNFANPKFSLHQTGKEIVIHTSDRAMVLKIGKAMSETLNKKKMKGYQVSFDGQKNWHLAQLKQDGSDNGGTSISKKQPQKKVKPQPKDITTRLMDFVADPKKNAKPITNQADVGNYAYRSMVGQSRAYGQITLNADGTYQNSISVHAVQQKNQTDDNPDVAYYEVSTGQIAYLYGKYYLVPKNLLRISYYVHGQDPDKPLPQKIALYTGDNIGLARSRIEHQGNEYHFFSKDYEPWPNADQPQNQPYTSLTKTDNTQISLPEIYQAAVKQYNDWKQTPIQSNKALMQVVAAMSDNNRDRVGDMGVNFSGSFGVTQQPSDYKGVAKDGSQQPQMNYVFAVSPASNQSGSAVISTESGDLLVFGSLDNQLYLLHQPDSDSATVTWMKMADVTLGVPQLRVQLNP